MVLYHGRQISNMMGLKKSAKLSKDQRVSLIKRLTNDDQNPNVERIESIRKAVKIDKKNCNARKIR
jgi:ribonuclease HII